MIGPCKEQGCVIVLWHFETFSSGLSHSRLQYVMKLNTVEFNDFSLCLSPFVFEFKT